MNIRKLFLLGELFSLRTDLSISLSAIDSKGFLEAKLRGFEIFFHKR